MRLVNMDVDRFGTNQRCKLGPLSEGLNAVFGPRGAGKSTLLSWLQLVVAECNGPISGTHHSSWSRSVSPASGSVEIRSRGVEFQVSTDRNGRIQFDSLGKYRQPLRDSHDAHPPMLSSVQREAFAGLAAARGSTDTSSALEHLAQTLGLSAESGFGDSLSRLREREHELALRLEQTRTHQNESRETLLAQQQQLESELATAKQQASATHYVGHDVERRRLQQRCAAIEADLQATVEQIEELDRAIATKVSELSLLDGTHEAAEIGDSYRQQLQRLDDRLNRWRQTLRDLKNHREALEYNATDAQLDKQIGDQLSSTKNADPRAAMRSLEAQILNTRQQLDVLVDRYTNVPGYDYRAATSAISRSQPGVVRDSSGRVYLDASDQTFDRRDPWVPESSSLPDTLRTMQKDLQEVCQQLARYESKTATETLQQQTLQLKRCEQELLQSVQKLIEERAALLRKIADEHHMSVEQLTLAFGNWCQCHDHPHLREWLLETETSSQNDVQSDSSDRPRLMEETELLRQQRKQASLRADECRRQIREASVHQSYDVMLREPPAAGRSATDIQLELERTRTHLRLVDNRRKAELELEDVQRQLRDLPSSREKGGFYDCVDGHIAALMPTGSTLPNSVASPQTAYSSRRTEPRYERRYDLVDGLVIDSTGEWSKQGPHCEVPEAVVRLALRLGIGDALARRGDPICLVLDESLDRLPSDILRSAVAHLSAIANQGQQIVVLSSDERIEELIRSYQGVVFYLQEATASVPDRSQDVDVNRHLAALANDHEADKWHQPAVASNERPNTSEFYLHERSLIEDLPSIEPAVAARCRALGVDRIGDLLDVDPHWLTDNLRIDSVGYGSVINWQAKARLLCSVRNLRPFDASVLVGIGIRSPRQLADMHPRELLERVEHFLATEHGRRILRSGNSYELSRITSWIASAEGGVSRYGRSSFSDERSANRAVAKPKRSRRARADGSEPRYSTPSDSRGTDKVRSRRARKSSGRSSRAYPVIDRDGSRSAEWESHPVDGRVRPTTKRSSELKAESTASGDELRFYLELSNPVVDAPSIGPRGAAKLEQHGIYSVGDFLAANAESLASKLKHRRAGAETIGEWQEQARLVCRIPNLRGHDAQLLVACGLTSPEEIAELDADAVLTSVLEIARSKKGQRILRGGKEPDLEEVTDWITWAASCRSLNAA